MPRYILILILHFFWMVASAQGEAQVDSLKQMDNETLLSKYHSGMSLNHRKDLLHELEQRDLPSSDQIRVFLTAGNTYGFLQDFASSQKYFTKAYELANKIDDKSNIGAILIGLAETAYRLEDYPSSKKYFNEYKTVFDKIPESPRKILAEMDYDRIYYLNGEFDEYRNRLEQLYGQFSEFERKNKDPELENNFLLAKALGQYIMAKTSVLLNDKEAAAKHITQARQLLSSKSDLEEILKDSYQMGEVYITEMYYANFTGKYDASLEQAKALYEYAEKNSFNDYKFIALVGESNIYFLKKDYKESLSFAEKSLKNIAPTYDFFNYELEAYRLAYVSAKALNQKEKALEYSTYFIDKSQKVLDDKKRAVLSNILSSNQSLDIENELSSKAETNQKLWWIIGLLILVTGLLLAYVIYRNWRYQKDYKRFKEIVKEAKKTRGEKTTNQLNQKSTTVVVPDPKETESSEPDEKTKELLEALKAFEKTEIFTEQDMSAAYLANYLKTNTGTLSNVINTYKKRNFNDYINHLRINYIVEKLQNDKKYRTYKISYLANDAGFSSHSLFSVAFKKHKGMPPSRFIKFLNK